MEPVRIYWTSDDGQRAVCGALVVTCAVAALSYNPHHYPAIRHDLHIESPGNVSSSASFVALFALRY